MHSRGDAGTNKDYSTYRYARQSTVEGVRIELGARVDEIVRGRGGVRRWLVIVDPGIGFSKTVEGNLEVLRAAQDVVGDVMIGDPSGCLIFHFCMWGLSTDDILLAGSLGTRRKPASRIFAAHRRLAKIIPWFDPSSGTRWPSDSAKGAHLGHSGGSNMCCATEGSSGQGPRRERDGRHCQSRRSSVAVIQSSDFIFRR